MYCWVFGLFWIAFKFAHVIVRRVLVVLSRHTLNPFTRWKPQQPEITGQKMIAALSTVGILAIKVEVFGEDLNPTSQTLSRS